MNFFSRMFKGYENHMIRRGREEARHILLTRSDRTLEDLGFSREALESGIDEWPWHVPEETTSDLASDYQNAIAELQRLNDRELQDLGISRSKITESVYLGREGIEQERKVA